MRTSTLVAVILLAATTVAAADKDKKYTLADLKALVKDQAYKEAVMHLGDVAPSERTAEWQDIAGQVTVGMVGTGKDSLEKLGIMVAIEGEYPVVVKNAKYAALRTEEAPKGFDACFQNDYQLDECMGYAKKFVDDTPTNGKLALAIAKAARHNMFAYSAAPLFKRAVTADKAACKDDDLSLSVVAALGLPEDQDNAKIGRDLASTCWSDLKKPISTELAKDDSSYMKKNACAVPAIKKDRDAGRLCVGATK